MERRAHWREREGDGSRLHLTWATPGQRENTATVAKQKKLPSAGLAPQERINQIRACNSRSRVRVVQAKSLGCS